MHRLKSFVVRKNWSSLFWFIIPLRNQCTMQERYFGPWGTNRWLICWRDKWKWAAATLMWSEEHKKHLLRVSLQQETVAITYIDRRSLQLEWAARRRWIASVFSLKLGEWHHSLHDTNDNRYVIRRLPPICHLCEDLTHTHWASCFLIYVLALISCINLTTTNRTH